jgi:hypothetical protein
MQALKMVSGTITEKWNKMAMVLMIARLQAIRDMTGLEGQHAQAKVQEFSFRISQCKDDPNFAEITAKEHSIMEYILENTFGKPVPPRTDLKITRRLAFNICKAAFTPAFMDSLLSETKGLNLEQKNCVIIQKVHELQTSVFILQGFGGDDGFLTAQMALIEHISDGFVQYQTAAYNTLIVEATGLQDHVLPSL